MKYGQFKTIISQNKNNPDRLNVLLDGLLDSAGRFTGYQELEMENRYLDAHVDISDTKDVVSLHSHNFYEILYCNSGDLQYLVGNTRYRLQNHDIVIVPPGMSHCPLFLKEMKKPYKRTVIWLNTTFYQNCMQFFAMPADNSSKTEDLPYVIRPTGVIKNQLEQLFETLSYECSSQRSGSELYLIGLFLQIFCLLYRDNYYCESNVPQTEKSGLLDQILHYIELHLSENLSLASISKEFMVSQSAISQLFKKQMDTSFYKVVTQRRLIEAKNLINSGVSLKETAIRCGFSDYSVFYKAFVKEYGISPRDFRYHT